MSTIKLLVVFTALAALSAAQANLPDEGTAIAGENLLEANLDEPDTENFLTPIDADVDVKGRQRYNDLVEDDEDMDVKGRRRRWGHVHHRHRPHVHHRHKPHLHHRHNPHIHIPHMHITLKTMLSSVSNAFKYLGKKFEDLYNSFKSMVGSKFKLPTLDFMKVGPGFKKAADTIRPNMALLAGAANKGQEMLLQAQDKWVAFGAYAAVKLGEKAIVKPIVDSFCSIVKIFTNPIRNAFNKVTKLITGIIPSWLIKIAAFGGIGFLASFLFSAFTVGYGFGYTFGVTTASFEVGFAFELKSNLQIGSTGCYLGGSSGITMGDVGVSTGFAVSAFKVYGNIAGDSATIGVEGDLCKFFALPCELSLSGGLIWDNSNWHNGDSVALKTFKQCLGPGAMYGDEIELLQVKHEAMLNMLQTQSKEDMEKALLETVYDFFKKGFGKLKTCIVGIFNLWIGLTLDVAAGVSVGAPVKGTFTLDYCYCN